MLDLTLTAIHNSDPLSVPQDGDDLDALVVQDVFQTLGNRAEMGLAGLLAQLAWTGTLAVSGTAAAPVVVVGAIESCVLQDANNAWRAYATTGESTLGAANVEGGGSLTADTWYYVYGWSDSAAPTSLKFQISTTPPTTALAPTVPRLWKRGEDANYRYLGAFYAGTSGNPRPVRAARGVYVYRASALAFPAVSTDVAAVGWTDTSLASVLPPHARLASLRCEVESLDVADNAALELRTKGDTTSSIALRAGFAGSATITEGDINTVVIEIETDSAQAIQRQVTGTAPSVSVLPHGWRE